MNRLQYLLLCLLRIGKTKSMLKNQLKVEVSERHIESKITCSVIDGSAVLYISHWPFDGKIRDYIDNFKSYIRQILNKYDVYLVFYRYMEFSTKSVARSGRQSNASRVFKLMDDMALPTQKVMIGVTENKQQLIPLICKAFCTDKEFHHLCTQTHTLVVTGDHDTPTEIYKGVIMI
ncbi:hypothetical protein DPMN_143169 [Dreissena polymorpha]|uniref:NYN domain-containing protein n=1 Tax=Dreissena polymorpha TaxID=45954 RepID=A0A9D4GFQ7_DREPO|nr:hypothetical protein DPMN_143169 [Dreissena polymorpha]